MFLNTNNKNCSINCVIMIGAYSRILVKLLLFGIFSYLVYIWLKACWRRRHLYYYASNVKGPLSFPVVGSAYIFFGGTQNVFGSFIHLSKKYGNLYKLWLGNKLCFVISKPEDVQVVLNSTVEKLPHYKFLAPVFGNGLINLPGAEWKIHRKLLNVTFNQRILNTFVRTFANYSNVLADILGEKDEQEFFDLTPILTQYTIDIIGDTIMGVQPNTMKEESQNLILWTSRLSELAVLRMTNPLLQPDFVWKRTSICKETQILSQKVHNLIKSIIETKRSEKCKTCENTNLTKHNFLEHIFTLEDNNNMWTEEMSVAETQTIVVAGGDATALTIGYVLMMLGMHQEIQGKIYNELISIFDNNREVVLEDLSHLSYLERVIKETLRLFPIGPILGRHLKSDIILGGRVFPKSSSVLIPIISMHRDDKVWPEPLKFDPDRFLPSEVSKRHSCSYLPFSSGPRNCIGFKYGMMAMKTVLATILRHYKVVETGYNSISEIEIKTDVATKCVKGQNVKLQRRCYRS